MTSSIQEIIRTIHRHNNFVLTTHVNPDGDGLGSELALAFALRQMGKTAAIVNHSATPENYCWMDPAKEIIQFIPEQHRELLLQAEVILILDTNQPERLRSMEPFVRQSSAIKVVIDH